LAAEKAKSLDELGHTDTDRQEKQARTRGSGSSVSLGRSLLSGEKQEVNKLLAVFTRDCKMACNYPPEKCCYQSNMKWTEGCF